MLDVQGLRFSYGRQEVLAKVDMQLQPGRLHAIVGANGAGKSTLIKLLAGLLDPTQGAVLYKGELICAMNDKQRARRMAYMAQELHVPADFTAKEMVEMARYARETDEEDEKAVLDAMERTRTIAFSDRRIGELSGGEKQRVLLARAFAQGTDVLLLDEVTSALDLHYQLAVMEDLRDWLTPEHIIVMVLHDINLAARYADEIWLMKDKGIHLHGAPASVIHPDSIRSVYRVDSITERNPVTDSPIVIPVKRQEKKLPLRLHVIAGGGSGRALYAALYRYGASVSTGVLNLGDTDHTIAKRLGMQVYETHPFSHVEEEDIAAVSEADAVLLTNLAVGPGNRKNLELALRRAEKVPLLYCPWQVGAQFIHKEDEALWQEVLARAKVCPDEDALVHALQELLPDVKRED